MFFMLVFILSLNIVSSLKNEELYQCKAICSVNFKLNSQACTSDYNFCKAYCTNLECKKRCTEDRVLCKKEFREYYGLCKNSCMLGSFSVAEYICESNGGSYQQLCNGNYFDLRCSTADYCVCSGDLNYSCPLNYSCVKNFSVKNIPTIETSWKSSTGVPMGDIGICRRD